MLTKEFDPAKIEDRLQMKAIALRRPLSCTFELTYHCNFRCPMCYIRMTDEQAAPFGRLRTVEEWIDMAHQVHDAGVFYLTLTGGECTRYPGFERLYREISKMGFRVSIMSNAGAYSEELKELFKAFPPYGVSVTLYGGSNETYEKVTGDPRGLDKVLGNIRFFMGIGVHVYLNFTMIRQNVMDYPKVGEICRSLGLPYTLITDITAHNRDASYSDALRCRLSPAERACVVCHLPDEVETAMQNARILEQELTYYTPPTAKVDARSESNACVGSYSGVAILWNGDMQTCLSFADTRCLKPFETGFEAAWQQLQADHEKRFARPAVCVDCEMKEECIHSCAARNFEGTGDPQTPDPENCRYVWLLRRYKEQQGRKLIAESPACV